LNFQIERELENAAISLLDAQPNIAADGDIDVIHADSDKLARRERRIEVSCEVAQDLGYNPEAFWNRAMIRFSVRTAKGRDESGALVAQLTGWVREQIHRTDLPAILTGYAENGLIVEDRSARIGASYRTQDSLEHIHEIILNCIVTMR